MSAPDLSVVTNDDLIAELINRTTFAGIVVWDTANARNATMKQPTYVETKMAKSPPLSRQDCERLLVFALQSIPGLLK